MLRFKIFYSLKTVYLTEFESINFIKDIYSLFNSFSSPAIVVVGSSNRNRLKLIFKNTNYS